MTQTAHAVITPPKRSFLREVHDTAVSGEIEWTDAVLERVRELAADADWSVRQDVAQLLVLLPEDDFNVLSPELLKDSNAYVKRAAEHSRQRRRVAHQEARRASRGLDQFAEQYELFARRYGEEITAEAMRLGERRFELISGALAHDLLGMLTSLRSNARSLFESVGKKDLAKRASAQDLNDGLGLIERSLRDLLAYAQPTPVERSTEQLAVVIRRARQMATKALDEQGFDLEPIKIDDSGVQDAALEISLHLIVSAIGNLIKNACEAMQDKAGNVAAGIVTITSAIRDGRVEVSIHNTGKGLTAEKLRALTSWLPGRKNRNKKHSTGYGVLNAKKNIEEHGGTLSFLSQPGAGVTAIITLPL